MCTAVYVFKHSLFKGMFFFGFVFFQSSRALLRSFFLAFVQLQHKYTQFKHTHYISSIKPGRNIGNNKHLSGMLGPPVEFEEGGNEISVDSGGANSQISIKFVLCFTEYHILTSFESLGFLFDFTSLRIHTRYFPHKSQRYHSSTSEPCLVQSAVWYLLILFFFVTSLPHCSMDGNFRC